MKQATRIQFAVGLGAVDVPYDLDSSTTLEQAATDIAHSLLCSHYGGASVHYGTGIWCKKPGDLPTIERTLYLTADSTHDKASIERTQLVQTIAQRLAQQLAALFKQRAVHVSYWPITTGDIYHADNSNV